MEIAPILLDLAIILFATKMLGVVMRKFGLPQVVGAVIAGLLIGPAIWTLFVDWSPIQLTDDSSFFFSAIAEIGVVMILFSAGLETDLKELKNTGAKSTIIALGGVFVPLIVGFLITIPFIGGFSALTEGTGAIEAVFIGVILTATSVGITVETLREMGKLKGKIGQAILSAAIIDDVIGIVILSVLLSINGGDASIGETLGMIGLFFVLAIVMGLVLHRLFKWMVHKYPGTRRVPIIGLCVCFVYAFLAEEVFGIADITGAYVAGISLCGLRDTEYIDRKIDINSYMIFSPVFFAMIGINTSFDGITGTLILFSAAICVVGIITKVLGSGACARMLGFNNRESFSIGAGMVARGEVALVICTKGLDAGIFADSALDPTIAVIMLVIVTSLAGPLMLKLGFGKGGADDGQEMLGGSGTAQEPSVESTVAI